MVNKQYVSWEQVNDFIKIVADVYSDKNITGVYGLPRGGLVFAVMLSNKLNVPFLGAPCENCLIVDDICDSGESLLHYAKNSSGQKLPYHIVTMFYKQNDLQVYPEYWSHEKGDNWIVFPWEEV